ncbi:MAG: NAD(P)/FAD-dependent oxidoreductase, partial [Myxococcota bacterium]
METALVLTALSGCSGMRSGRAPAPLRPDPGADEMNEQIDVVIVGGGPAGMTAALYLGRARKRVVVLDEQKPRHAVSAGVHNFLTRDGMDPGQLRQVAWAQMERYDSVRLVAGRAHSMAREGDAWQIESSAGRRLTSRAVLLAPGIIDEHPRIPGYDERWGASIHHCPYCHGWEMRELPLAVLAHGDAAMHMAPLLQGWSDDVILISHGQTITDEERATL